MASNFLKNGMTLGDLAALSAGGTTPAYLAALKKLSTAGAVKAEAIFTPNTDGMPPYVKSVNIAGSGNAELDGAYLEMKSAKKWLDDKSADLVNALNETTAMVKELSKALEIAHEKIGVMAGALKHVPHTIVTDLVGAFSDGNTNIFHAPHTVYISATPGGKCFEAVVQAVESYTDNFSPSIGVSLIVKTAKNINGWNAPMNNPLVYDPLVSQPQVMPKWVAEPADMKWGTEKVDFKSALASPQPKWMPPTVKPKGDGPQLSHAAKLKNELAAKKADMPSALQPSTVDQLTLAQEKVNKLIAEMNEQQMYHSKVAELMEKMTHYSAFAGDLHAEPKVAEKWVPEGYVAVSVIGQKEKQLVKKYEKK